MFLLIEDYSIAIVTNQESYLPAPVLRGIYLSQYQTTQELKKLLHFSWNIPSAHILQTKIPY